MLEGELTGGVMSQEGLPLLLQAREAQIFIATHAAGSSLPEVLNV